MFCQVSSDLRQAFLGFPSYITLRNGFPLCSSEEAMEICSLANATQAVSPGMQIKGLHSKPRPNSLSCPTNVPSLSLVTQYSKAACVYTMQCIHIKIKLVFRISYPGTEDIKLTTQCWYNLIMYRHTFSSEFYVAVW